jgi:GT2 family glycosyltransferase
MPNVTLTFFKTPYYFGTIPYTMLECRPSQTDCISKNWAKFMGTATNLSVIILNWNAADDTINCVQNFANWQQIRPAIWVVDNASLDDSADLIAETYPEVNLIRNTNNQGYTGANNRGLEKALAASDAPVMLLNNDAKIAEADVLKLLNVLKDNPNIGIVGPLMFDSNQPDKLLNAGGQNMIQHLSSHISKVTTDSRLQIVDYVPGTVLIAKHKVFNAVGLLDEAYFFGGELPDFCHRAKQKGYLSAVDTQARAFHATERSAVFRKTLYPYYIIRNRFIFIRKFYGVSRIVYFGFWTLYSIALSLKLRLSNQPQMAQAVWLGLVDGRQQRFGNQNDRVLSACGVNLGKPGSQ